MFQKKTNFLYLDLSIFFSGWGITRKCSCRTTNGFTILVIPRSSNFRFRSRTISWTGSDSVHSRSFHVQAGATATSSHWISCHCKKTYLAVSTWIPDSQNLETFKFWTIISLVIKWSCDWFDHSKSKIKSCFYNLQQINESLKFVLTSLQQN